MATKQSETNSYYRITIRGIVQGVGFRPFVYREAKTFGLSGYVKNNSGEVDIFAVGPDTAVLAFVESVKRNKPRLSFIKSCEVRPAQPPKTEFEDFIILESGTATEPAIRFFSPDLGLCEDCRREIFDPTDRRARHYFNTCTNCGPRFTVLKAFPYDREKTSMDVFPMCEKCAVEYTTPGDRRFHAETVCCNECGPVLSYKRGDDLYSGDEAFAEAVQDLKAGQVVAIKGIGGYHLACSPYDADAVRNLRVLKAREEKPFAIMFRDLAAIAEVCEMSREDEDLLTSPARPIVLLKMKQEKRNAFTQAVLNGADGRCGCFLPYTPLQALLFDSIPCLIMTSANRSSSPILKTEAEIFALTDRVLYNNREIVRSVDDSVLQTFCGKPQFTRRARGYTPSPIFFSGSVKAEKPILALGGDLKSAFGFLQDQTFTLSQYIGDLENTQVFQVYEAAIPDFENLFAIQPRAIVCDAHPRYFSARLAKKLAAERNIPLIPVYHHHAHIASVQAEHGLSRVLGFSFDGSGYGEDGTVWGGEFLLCEGGNCKRVGHLATAELLGADEAAKDARKTAACYLRALRIPNPEPSKGEELVYAALDNHINTFTTSSMGRLFDAVSAILGVCQTNSYEGECAILLQYAAEAEARAGIAPLEMRFIPESGLTFGYRDIFEKCLTRQPGAALGFHTAVCEMVSSVCLQLREAENINDIALSGGVFQNVFLLEMLQKRLTTLSFAVYTNEAVPPNDGGLALGQAYIAAQKL